MDTLTPMGRRYAAPPSSVGGGEYQDHRSHPPPPPPMQHPQPGQFWYPPPPSSAPSGEPQFYPPHHHLQQHPAPPMVSGPFHPLPPPHYPQHQPHPAPPPPWAPPPDHLQQSYQYQPSNFPPPVPPPSGMHLGGPSPAAATGSPHRHGVSPPNPPYPGVHPVYPPPAHPSHAPAPPLPPVPSATLPHAYSQPIQTWENPSWHTTQGWEYSDSKFHYNNEEDWAARARAWAAANSATESLPMQPHYMPSGTQNNVYHDQYQLGSGPPFTDSQPSSLSTQDQQFADSATDLHRRVNSSQESSLNSLSYSVPNFPTYDARNEGLATDTSVTPSPPQRNFSSSTSVNVQEVPSSYSSVSGNKEAVDQFEKLSVPPHLSSPVISVPGQLPTSAVNSVSREQSHLPYRDQTVEYPCTGDRPQAIEQVPFDRSQVQNAGFANADQGRTIDQGLPLSSIHGWAQSIPPGPLFPHVTPVPPGPQFDSSSISSSLPGHPTQVFGRIQGPNFQPGIPPVNSPFGFDSGSSLHPVPVFPLDANEAFNLSERPKKAAVPNWLRDEIIKKKATITSSTHEHSNGDKSTVAEVHEKVSRKDDLADSKSIDSTRSTEDEDDDEDDMDAARSATINQEIKRVLTDVLLKVTDELFEEIATKVVNEDELEVDHTAVVAKHKESLSPPPSTTPKSSTKVMVPAATAGGKSGPVGQSLLGSGGLLGLANYASDDDSEETPGSNVPFTEKADDSSDQREIRDATSDHSLKEEKISAKVTAEVAGDGPMHAKSDKRNNAGSNGVLHKNLLEIAKAETAVKSLESGATFDRKVVVREKVELESESAHGDHGNGKSKTSQVTESLSKSRSSDVPHDRKDSSGRNFTREVESVGAKGNREGVGSGNLKKQVSRDQKPEKTDELGTSRRRSKDRSSKQASDGREPESRRAMYHDNDMNDKKGSGREKKDRMKEDDHWKRERTRDEKEDRFREVRDAHRPKSRQALSPSTRGRSGRESSLGSPSDDSGEEISETSKKRKLQSSRQSLSPSPTRSRRQVLRSPHSKHTQRRHSPYSHSDTRRRRRSRSSSPAHRKRSGQQYL
ncbi:hypothetical protein Taro_019679 [Colocasia esculenta]|uniref:Uncharacterized protein n=1 Tax=Colocasia esculenta TaxID=4460 RepID=A0A843UZY0_COLES|nr:hypothetical protein [Colocasia esculenta]